MGYWNVIVTAAPAICCEALEVSFSVLISLFKVSLFSFPYCNYLLDQVKDGSNISGNARNHARYGEMDQIFGTLAVSCPRIVEEVILSG